MKKHVAAIIVFGLLNTVSAMETIQQHQNSIFDNVQLSYEAFQSASNEKDKATFSRQIQNSLVTLMQGEMMDSTQAITAHRIATTIGARPMLLGKLSDYMTKHTTVESQANPSTSITEVAVLPNTPTQEASPPLFPYDVLEIIINYMVQVSYPYGNPGVPHYFASQLADLLTTNKIFYKILRNSPAHLQAYPNHNPYGNPMIVVKELEYALKVFPNTEKIDIRFTNIPSSYLQQLTNSKVKAIHIEDVIMDVTDKNSDFPHLPHLTSFSLAQNNGMASKGGFTGTENFYYNYASKLTNLTSLNLYHSGESIRANGFFDLNFTPLSTLTNLTELRTDSFVGGYSPVSFKDLQGLTNLQTLTFIAPQKKHFDAHNITHLTPLKNLHALTLGHDIVDAEILKDILELGSVKDLTLTSLRTTEDTKRLLNAKPEVKLSDGKAFRDF